jgi:hypothetical protein
MHADFQQVADPTAQGASGADSPALAYISGTGNTTAVVKRLQHSVCVQRMAGFDKCRTVPAVRIGQ